MSWLRNPFAVRDGNIILIEDLTAAQRGAKCHCKCPACNGDFIARMGDVKVHHFAHSKDACDEILAYMSGLYKLVKQIFDTGAPFFVPDLAISYSFPENDVLNENNVCRYIKIVSKNSDTENKMIVSKGRYIVFDNSELSYDNKNHIKAIELEYMNNRMAIKIMPPDTVCKMAAVPPHKEMSTLVLNFTEDADKIQFSNSTEFQKYLLSDTLNKFWVFNSKIKKIYPQLFALSQKAYQDRIEALQQACEAKKLAEQRYIAQKEEQERLYTMKKEAEIAEDKAKSDKLLAKGYEQVKDKFTQQEDPIYDSFNNRWVQCELCGEIKEASEFSVHGGINHANLGKCKKCLSIKYGYPME